MHSKIMKRHGENPLITPEMVKPSNPTYRVRGAFNPGAVAFGDEIILLLRVAEDCPAGEGKVAVPRVNIQHGAGRPEVLEVAVDDPQVTLKDTRGIVYRGINYLSTMSHLRLARSKDGVHFTVDEKPFLFPSDASEIFGVEDPRITPFEGTYYINYTCVSPDGWATALAVTKDFQSVERKGIIFPPQNKDVSLFPEKIHGLYHALHRPDNSGFGRPSIWYARSPDLFHWGNHQSVLRPRAMIWEEQKIGGGAPSIKTPEGWLQVYHAKGRDQVYSLFTVLLDLENPSKVIKQSQEPILKSEEAYEKEGFFPDVVFSNGLIAREDGHLRIYYGACDCYTCAAETTLDELLASLD